MSRLAGILSVLVVVVLAMAFAAANAGHRVTLDLGLLTLYRIPVTLVAFGGLLVGMLVMFSTGIYTDLKVRRILRDRLEEESRREQGTVDRDQQDLFAGAGEEEAGLSMDTPQPAEPIPGEIRQPAPLDPFPASGDGDLREKGEESMEKAEESMEKAEEETRQE